MIFMNLKKNSIFYNSIPQPFLKHSKAKSGQCFENGALLIAKIRFRPKGGIVFLPAETEPSEKVMNFKRKKGIGNNSNSFIYLNYI